MPQRLAYPARPLPGNRRQGEIEAVARQLRASNGICPSGQDGMGLRLFGTLHGEHVGELGRHPFTEDRSEEHTSELQSLMRISYAVFCLKKQKIMNTIQITSNT